MTEERMNLDDEFRGALMEAKESLEDKRELNTIDDLINELKVDIRVNA